CPSTVLASVIIEFHLQKHCAASQPLNKVASQKMLRHLLPGKFIHSIANCNYTSSLSS
ncbi:unnamed protein product, partial [Amoebophrya sp. A25]